MGAAREIRIDLIRLVNGERVLRLSEETSGLSLERKLDPREPVARQKERLEQAFEMVLARELPAPA